MVSRLPLPGLFGRLCLLCGLLAALAVACGGERPAVPATPTLRLGRASQAVATASLGSGQGTADRSEASVTEMIDRVRAWGIVVEKAQSSVTIADPFLLSPGAAYSTASATLFVFPYADESEALAASAQVPPDADDTQLRWAEDVDYFLCGRVIILQYGPDGRADHALRDLCGPPFASGKSRY